MENMDPLDEQQVLDEAARRFGEAAALEDEFRPALTTLLTALGREARLSPSGRDRARERIVGELGRRAALASAESRDPDLAATPVERPIVITGFPRTGTTLLHNLLARVDGLWAPPLWQLRSPIVPVELADADRDAWAQRQRAEAQAALDLIFDRAPELRAIRPASADWPDECNWLLRNSFSTLVNAFAWFVPSYARLLSRTDMTPAYADHRRWLRALLHQRRDGARPRLVLKDPLHLWQLEALIATYPDATVIHLHRDPVEVAPSFASFCATYQTVDSDAPRSRAEIGAYTLTILDNGLRALERSRATLPSERFIDLPYRELVAAPGSVVGRLGRQLGFSTSHTALAGADQWLRENSQNKAGRHRYTADDFGLSADILDEQFADYRARFANLLV